MLTASPTDVLSHVAIRARSQGVLLATCFDEAALEQLKVPSFPSGCATSERRHSCSCWRRFRFALLSCLQCHALCLTQWRTGCHAARFLECLCSDLVHLIPTLASTEHTHLIDLIVKHMIDLASCCNAALTITGCSILCAGPGW